MILLKELVLGATTTAMANAKGVAEEVLYFNAWWCRNLVVARAVAAYFGPGFGFQNWQICKSPYCVFICIFIPSQLKEVTKFLVLILMTPMFFFYKYSLSQMQIKRLKQVNNIVFTCMLAVCLGCAWSWPKCPIRSFLIFQWIALCKMEMGTKFVCLNPQ